MVRKRGIKEEYFAKASVFEFAASWILYMPEEFFNDIPDSLPALRIIESIITALLRSLNLYLGEGYERKALTGFPVFSSIYAMLMVLVNIVLLLFVAGLLTEGKKSGIYKYLFLMYHYFQPNGMNRLGDNHI